MTKTRTVAELDRRYAESGCLELTAAETDVLLAHHWRLAETAKDAAARKKARKRAFDVAESAFGAGAFEADVQYDHDDVEGTSLCDRVIEVLRAKKEPPGVLARVERVRDKPLTGPAKTLRALTARVKDATQRLFVGCASDADVACVLDALLTLEEGNHGGFRARDRMRDRLESVMTKPDPRMLAGARQRVTADLVKRAHDFRDPKMRVWACYGAALLRVTAANGDLTTARRTYQDADKTSRKYNLPMTKAALEILLPAAPKELFRAIFKRDYAKYVRIYDLSGIGVDEDLHRRTALLLERWPG
jgi:hypothetical protein